MTIEEQSLTQQWIKRTEEKFFDNIERVEIWSLTAVRASAGRERHQISTDNEVKIIFTKSVLMIILIGVFSIELSGTAIS